MKILSSITHLHVICSSLEHTWRYF